MCLLCFTIFGSWADNPQWQVYFFNGIQWVAQPPIRLVHVTYVWLQGSFHQTGRCFAKIPIFSLWENWKIQVSYPICSICPKNHPNVGKYTIHGAYGYDYQYPMFLCWCYCPSAKQEIFDQFDKESRCSWGSFDVLRWAFVYWLVVWNMFYFPFHTLDNPSHWLSFFFQRDGNHQPV